MFPGGNQIWYMFLTGNFLNFWVIPIFLRVIGIPFSKLEKKYFIPKQLLEGAGRSSICTYWKYLIVPVLVPDLLKSYTSKFYIYPVRYIFLPNFLKDRSFTGVHNLYAADKIPMISQFYTRYWFMFFLYASYRSFTRNSWWSKKADFIFSTHKYSVHTN